MRRLIIVAFAAMLAPAIANAGVYQPDSLIARDIDERGLPEVLPLDVLLMKVGNLKRTDKPDSDEAKALQKRIVELEGKVATGRKVEDVIELAGDYLRFRHDHASVAKALNLLQPFSRTAPDDVGFVVLSLQAQAHFLNSTFQEASTNQLSAVSDYSFPTKIAGLSPAQLKWYRRLERDYNLAFFRLRMKDAEQKRASNKEEVDAIFPAPGKDAAEPVRFVGASGKFEAGTIVAKEKAKLPPDAIAIVQQMILWHVDDGRLWWLLAELYNAEGDLKNSARAFEVCIQALKYTNVQTLKHSEEVLAALEPILKKEAQDAELLAKTEDEKRSERREKAELRAKSEEDARKAEEEKSAQARYERRQKYEWAIAGGAAVVLLMGYWQAREIFRRAQIRRKKATKQLGRVD